VPTRAIEESFPIVEINRLAAPERNAFKPIYQMHKWFARRASSVFRAILLGCLKPAGTDIMAEFYKDHTHDPDTNGKVVLDPFMGGGTTVVEALRLGCKVIGIDLNPVAWFIVKTEVEPVDLDELQAAFDRLAGRNVAWSGKSIRETLSEQYKTRCPCCGNTDADIIYTFWVKSAVCTNPALPCEKKTLVPLFSDYLIAQKSPSIRYWRDASCPKCQKTFDWEVEPATLIAEPELMVTSPTYSAGVGRTTTRWAYSSIGKVCCPWCKEEVTAKPAEGRLARKKVPLTVLLCPHCEAAWQWRGELPDTVSCPVCHRAYNPKGGNVPDKGKFICPACGTRDAIIQSIRRLPEDQLLPIHPYAIQGYCAKCGGETGDDDEEAESDLLGHRGKRAAGRAESDHSCLLTKTNGKFFTRVRPADLARYQVACARWEQEKARLSYPKSEIPDGQETHRLLEHHYRYWHQMFNPRQLLCLSTLLSAIAEESDQILTEMLLSAFFSTIEGSNGFARYKTDQTRSESAKGIFSRHDYQPKLTPCEDNVWGVAFGKGFSAWAEIVINGKAWGKEPSDNTYKLDKKTSGESKLKLLRLQDGSSAEAVFIANAKGKLLPHGVMLESQSSTDLRMISPKSLDAVITDPPYAGNVNYSELSDFFYVWLRLVLAKQYAQFAPEHTPKAEEVIENPTRGETKEDFEEGLAQVFRECHRLLKNEGLLVFTFHHAEGETWESLLRSVCNVGFEIEAVYPIHGEAESSLHLLDKEGAISYDLIHVCQKRPLEATRETRSWAGIRQEIRRRARDEIQAIETGRYGKGLNPADINIILIGKCLELYSRHYGAVVNHEGNEVTLHEALKEIRNLVDQFVSREQPLSAELDDIDAESRIYLLTLCDRKEIKSDEVHKATRGILEPEDLMAAGLLIKGRAGRGRTYEVKQPGERFAELLERFRRTSGVDQPSLFPEDLTKDQAGPLFIDYVHLLIAFAEGGENLLPWLERFRGETPRLRVACDYLAGRNKSFAPSLKKIRDLIEVGPLFRGQNA
jgi:adenine-specific DNA methylase